MSFTAAQRLQAIGLYKRLLRSAQETFQGDAVTASAWRQEVRGKFQAASRETDQNKIVEGLNMWEEVVQVLRQNVVQGKYRDDRNAFQLKFREETELGSNESIKQGRERQLEQLKASKGIPRCSPSSSASSSSSSSAPSSARQFSTSARSSASKATLSARLPRPAPHFPQTVLLSDGSSIQLNTTSPRSNTRLTRDPSNHPLWNPRMERRSGAGSEDESGRLGRFRKRFETGGDAAAGVAADAASGGVPKSREGEFGADDLDWMSVGGREARAGAAVQQKKAKGKK